MQVIAPVFISYLREDRLLVEELCKRLEEHGIPYWVDLHDLEPGLKWADQIVDAIESGGFFLACFSSRFLEKETSYMKEELRLAVDLLKTGNHHTAWFLPCRLDDCQIEAVAQEVDPILATLQWCDLFPSIDIGLQSLAPTLIKNSSFYADLYRSGTDEILSRLPKRMESKSGSTFIFYGNPGVGKSMVYRHLCCERDYSSKPETARFGESMILDCTPFESATNRDIQRLLVDDTSIFFYFLQVGSCDRIYDEVLSQPNSLQSERRIDGVFLNKIDLISCDEILSQVAKLREKVQVPIFPFSAQMRTNMHRVGTMLEELAAAMTERKARRQRSFTNKLMRLFGQK